MTARIAADNNIVSLFGQTFRYTNVQKTTWNDALKRAMCSHKTMLAIEKEFKKSNPSMDNITLLVDKYRKFIDEQ